MAFAWFAKQVRCPNCGHVGKAKLQGAGCGLLLIWLAAFIVSLYVWAFLFVTIPALLWLIFKPAKMVCAKCDWPHPVTVAGWRFSVRDVSPFAVLGIVAVGLVAVSLLNRPARDSQPSVPEDAVVDQQPVPPAVPDLPAVPAVPAAISEPVAELEPAAIGPAAPSEIIEAPMSAKQIAILECQGVKVLPDPQPEGHPPRAYECEHLLAEAAFEAAASQPPAPPSDPGK